MEVSSSKGLRREDDIVIIAVLSKSEEESDHFQIVCTVVVQID